MRALIPLLLLSALSGHAETPKGDADRGRLLFGQCRTCHYPEKGVGHNNGPALWNIFGRKAGSQAGFAYYSDTLKQSGLIWNDAYLDAWLADVPGFIPGTTMMSNGFANAQDRADVIAYLRQFSEAAHD